MIPSVEQVLEALTSDPREPSPFRFGTIPASYASGRPTVRFDGETTASTRTYPYLSSYTPTASDRVLLARAGNGWVVLGKVTT